MKAVVAFDGDDEIVSADWKVFFNSTDEANCPVVTCDLHEANCFAALNPQSNVYLDESVSKFHNNSSAFAIYAKTNVRKGYTQSVCLSCTNGHVRKYFAGIEVQQVQ